MGREGARRRWGGKGRGKGGGEEREGKRGGCRLYPGVKSVRFSE